MAISMLKIRRPLGRLIFNMGIAIPGKTVFLIETAPCFLNDLDGISKYIPVSNERYQTIETIERIQKIDTANFVINDILGRNNLSLPVGTTVPSSIWYQMPQT